MQIKPWLASGNCGDALNSDLRVAVWANGSVSDDIIIRDNGGLIYAPISVGSFDPKVVVKGGYFDHLSLSPISASEYREIVAHTSVEYATAVFSQYYALTNYEHTLLLGIGKTFEVPLNAQLALGPDYPPLVPGTFSSSFPDLDSMTSVYKGIKLTSYRDGSRSSNCIRNPIPSKHSESNFRPKRRSDGVSLSSFSFSFTS